MDKIENTEENIKNLIKFDEDSKTIDESNNLEEKSDDGTVVEEDMLDSSENYKLKKTKVTFKEFYKELKKNRLPIFSILVGMASHNYMNSYMKTGIDGVNYYGEAHLTSWNSWMHTIGMPFTIYGMVQWIPALFRLNPYLAHKLMMAMYFTYGGHYLRINLLIAISYFFFYYFPVTQGLCDYSLTYSGNIDSLKKKSDDISTKTLVKREKETYNQLLIQGLVISTAALVFQEVAGHWYGGDIPSRWEAIPNAIVYAKYFSLHHLFY